MAPNPAIADSVGTGWYVGGEGGNVNLEKGEGTQRDPEAPGQPMFTRFPVEYDDGSLFGVTAGYAFGFGRLEAELKQLENKILEPASSTLESSEIRAQAAFVNFWYGLGDSRVVRPYIGGGLGAVRYDLDDGADDSGTAGQVGLGVDLRFAKRWLLTTGYRYLDTAGFEIKRANRELSALYRGHLLSVGIRYNFFAPTKPAPPPEPVKVVAPAPICNDGVDNDADTLIDFPQDPGCESADDQDESDPPQCRDRKDNDDDGLIDYPDDKGCTDTEDDDEHDPCKTPEPGERVDLRGCGTGDVIALEGVHFIFNRSTLTVDSKRALDEVAEELLTYGNLRIEIGGHTDSKGSDDYNRRLSQSRAESVRDYLIERGVPAARLTAVGYGEVQPVADNETEEGRALNRRVELKILSVDEEVSPEAEPAQAEETQFPAATESQSDDPELDWLLETD